MMRKYTLRSHQDSAHRQIDGLWPSLPPNISAITQSGHMATPDEHDLLLLQEQAKDSNRHRVSGGSSCNAMHFCSRPGLPNPTIIWLKYSSKQSNKIVVSASLARIRCVCVCARLPSSPLGGCCEPLVITKYVKHHDRVPSKFPILEVEWP
jgi:hypothetical protein